jgi:CYTH domain-containing protein
MDRKRVSAFKKIFLAGSVFLSASCVICQGISDFKVNAAGTDNSETVLSNPCVLSDAKTQGEHLEIEKKFLIDYNKIPRDILEKAKKILEKAEKKKIVQYYIKFDPETRVRSIDNEKFFKTEKRGIPGKTLSRVEIEEEISREQYSEILKKNCSDFCVQKDRYNIGFMGVTIELDVYSEELKGLVVAEIEFDSEQDANKFTPPSWFGEDVTSNKEFKNASLAQKVAKTRSSSTLPSAAVK